MARKYNLSQGVQDGFEFVLTDPATKKDLEYHIQYPSAADFEPGKALDAEIDDLRSQMDSETATEDQKTAWQKRIDELEKEKARIFFKLVTPIDHKVDIEDVLNRVNVKVVSNFNTMITNEFGK